MLEAWVPFLIFFGVATLLAALLEGVGAILLNRRDRREDVPGHPRPDPDRAWTAIRTHCRRRIRASERRRRVEATVLAFLDEVADYERRTGHDPGPAREYLAEMIARELASKPSRSVRDALDAAQSLLRDVGPNGSTESTGQDVGDSAAPDSRG
ncbi:MAG TPA: hypothetical protein VMB81_13340 [Candidatus Sulfotelmatobacter sp.]|nr:hypothetical protein [Candidatus Sulfotelmatobacter sp.]